MPAALPRCLAGSGAVAAGGRAAQHRDQPRKRPPPTGPCCWAAQPRTPLPSSPVLAALPWGCRAVAAERGLEGTVPAKERLHSHCRLLLKGSGTGAQLTEALGSPASHTAPPAWPHGLCKNPQTLAPCWSTLQWVRRRGEASGRCCRQQLGLWLPQPPMPCDPSTVQTPGTFNNTSQEHAISHKPTLHGSRLGEPGGHGSRGGVGRGGWAPCPRSPPQSLPLPRTPLHPAP